MTSRSHFVIFALFISASTLAFPARAAAQEIPDRAAVTATTVGGSTGVSTARPLALRRADIERVVRTLPQVSSVNVAPIERSAAASAARQQRRGAGRIIAGAAVGALGGLFAGGYLGAAIEGDGCHCDDPGLMGALIGAPIGAVAGGILGGKFLF